MFSRLISTTLSKNVGSLDHIMGRMSIHSTPTMCDKRRWPLGRTKTPVTLQEMHDRGGPPLRRPRPSKVSFVAGQSQMKGVVTRVLIKKPKKPNSGNRKCVLVKLENGREKIAYIPGEGHNLQEHSQVMCSGQRKKDLIGVRLRVVRGKLDCAPVIKKTQ